MIDGEAGCELIVPKFTEQHHTVDIGARQENPADPRHFTIPDAPLCSSVAGEGRAAGGEPGVVIQTSTKLTELRRLPAPDEIALSCLEWT
jgi:hypothetical protein